MAGVIQELCFYSFNFGHRTSSEPLPSEGTKNGVTIQRHADAIPMTQFLQVRWSSLEPHSNSASQRQTLLRSSDLPKVSQPLETWDWSPALLIRKVGFTLLLASFQQTYNHTESSAKNDD